MDYKTYAGIGSRNTPEDFKYLLFHAAKTLAMKGYTLRSGGADGADSAFEAGADIVNGKKEIYLPWKGFNNSSSTLVVEEGKAYEIAEEFHPYWHNLKPAARKLQARNSHQVLGLDLLSPSQFILCYTPGGKRTGGTGQALRLAEEKNIPIFDFGCYEYKQSIEEFKLFMEKHI